MSNAFLLVIDANSQLHTTIAQLELTFAVHSLPVIISGNGAVFSTLKFKNFTKRTNMRRITSAPYHVSTNGLVKRPVETFEGGIKNKCELHLKKVSWFLFKLLDHLVNDYREKSQQSYVGDIIQNVVLRPVKTRYGNKSRYCLEAAEKPT